MIAPPDISPDMLRTASPMRGFVMVEIDEGYRINIRNRTKDGLLRTATGLLVTPRSITKRKRSRRDGVIFRLGEDVHDVHEGDKVWFHPREYVANYFTSGDRLFLTLPAENLIPVRQRED